MTLRKNKRGFSVLLYVIAWIETPLIATIVGSPCEKERRKKKKKERNSPLGLDWGMHYFENKFLIKCTRQ